MLPETAHGPARLFIAGDSSACTREFSRAPMTGWGQVLPLFFTPDVEIVNCARAGASSRTFAERGRLAWILDQLRPGDHLLVSFGLIDHKPEKELHTEPFADYQRYLRLFVDGARDRGAHPVLISPHERCTWDDHGNLRHVIRPYPMAMAELAEQTATPYVDLYTQSLQWWEQLGPQGTRALFTYLAPGQYPNYPDGLEDSTHLLPDGAVACARFIAHSLAGRGIVPPHWVTRLDVEHFPPEALGWLDDATHAALTRARTMGTGATL
ncbi:rhamnogalacturonan acetylesterase [Streptomyces poonensis]|uniref:Rhamnogalacturonan acetylesterase RhgT n=1 Tax=Streptomyces poonensis TaxID=68255 RepID=A0A918UQD6_9ACTN|nr:rhamnogalacturonan acetylesterase [Streptomyces poonensis]GGZ26139.1 rhamnogalacturonan acetylesterase RhgT [Streptomyces poonensis]GLJ89031.1 rhamnogalacturonan acetylesterase RhgT [Streptomyces poonensis]